jgi:ADP-glucose pyrophosphorylase
MSRKDVIAVVLGGGRGTRLYPLTKLRTKPAIPIGGKYRLLDVPISNAINSGITSTGPTSSTSLATALSRSCHPSKR